MRSDAKGKSFPYLDHIMQRNSLDILPRFGPSKGMDDSQGMIGRYQVSSKQTTAHTPTAPSKLAQRLFLATGEK